LETAALSAAAARIAPRGLEFMSHASASVADKKKDYGSGYFGEWMQDEFELPAFRYTCDQVHDKKAVTEVNPGLLGSTEHVHQVGNDRIVAIASAFCSARVGHLGRQHRCCKQILRSFAAKSIGSGSHSFS